MKLDFSSVNCESINLKDIFCCSLGLSKGEYEIFNILLKISKENKNINTSYVSNITSEYICSKLNLDKANTQRYLKNLTDKEIISRNKQNLSNGGFIYVYKIENIDLLKKIVLNNTKKLIKKVELELENI